MHFHKTTLSLITLLGLISAGTASATEKPHVYSAQIKLQINNNTDATAHCELRDLEGPYIELKGSNAFSISPHDIKTKTIKWSRFPTKGSLSNRGTLVCNVEGETTAGTAIFHYAAALENNHHAGWFDDSPVWDYVEIIPQDLSLDASQNTVGEIIDSKTTVETWHIFGLKHSMRYADKYWIVDLAIQPELK